jgi:putative hydroxymethylpyrimidine transport system substrate-binding protein
MRTLAALLALLLGFAAPATAQQRHVQVLLDWFVNPDHGPLIVAQELGLFRDAGLDVEIVAPSDPADPPRLVAAGRADIAITYHPQLIVAAADGVPLVRIATLIDTPLNIVMALADGPIGRIEDLRGRRVGFSVGGFEDGVLKVMLERHGLSLADVTMVNVNFSLSQALLAGQVDAVVGAYRNFELNQVAINGHPGRAFYPEQEGVPPYDELILAVNRARVGESQWRSFVDAMERAVHMMVNQPDAAWQVFIRNHRDLDDELNRRAWRDTWPRFSRTPAALDRARWQRFAAFMQAQGLVRTVPALESYAVELPAQ